MVVIDKSTELKEIEGEIDEIKWISSKELLLELKTNPQKFIVHGCLFALRIIRINQINPCSEKHANVLSTWMNSEVHDGLQKAIKIHLPE